MLNQAKLIADMLQPEAEVALKSALERFYQSGKIANVWPSAKDRNLPLSDVEIIVLPLDRIGAPAGASGASVYVAYYSHAVNGASRLAASLPLVVKIGSAVKLREECAGANKWPRLNDRHRGRFAFPLHLDDNDEARAILLAPFQSLFRQVHQGSRNDIEFRDLSKLLENKQELSPTTPTDWTKISNVVAQALDAMDPAHRQGLDRPEPRETDYASQYGWHLRQTMHGDTGSTRYILSALFGEEETTVAFGKEWVNPTSIVRRIVDHRMQFTGVLGPVHGDLHPRNIVLGDNDAVQIIDFGWATDNRHIALDYVLLDLNLRGTTLPAQISEASILKFAAFLRPDDEWASLPEAVRGRATVIKDVIWSRAKERVVRENWEEEYMIPLFLVGYGLLVYLDNTRNQAALVATVLQLAHELNVSVPTQPIA